MKKIVLLSVFILNTLIAFSQAEDIRMEIDFYKKTLQIQPEQEGKLSNIITKKYNDLVTISGLENSDEAKFRVKRRAVYRLSDNSIRMILKEEQLEMWDKYRKEKRARNAEAIKTLKSKNASKEDLKDAQYGIYN